MSTAQLHRFRAEVTVRVPRNGDGDLISEATRRLETTEVEQLAIIALGGVQPGLSATVVTVETQVETAETDAQRVASALSTAPGVEQVSEVRRA